jgi:hypothetical protein
LALATIWLSPERLSWVTAGTSPSAPNLTDDSRLFSDTERKYRQAVRLSKAVAAPYFAMSAVGFFLLPNPNHYPECLTSASMARVYRNLCRSRPGGLQ